MIILVNFFPLSATISTINPSDYSTTERKVSAGKLIDKVIQDLRDLTKLLNTDFISDVGLTHAIERQVQILQTTSMRNHFFGNRCCI